MTSFLAIETSSPACSVALQAGGLLISRYSEEPRSHTKLVMAMVNELLAEAKISVQQLNGIGVTIGPGSFTGLRIGFATVQGLAFAADIPVVAISTMETLVATYLRSQCADQKNEGKIIVSVLDARMGEFNLGCYQVTAGGKLGSLAADQLLDAQQAMIFIEKHQPQMIVGEAGQLLTEHPVWAAKYAPVFPAAVDVLAMTAAAHASGLAQPIESIELVYLRGTDAWQKRKRLRAV